MNPESIAYVTPEYEDGRKKRVEGEFADAHEFVPDCACRDCATTQRDRLSVALFQMQEASKDLAQREKTLLAAYHAGIQGPPFETPVYPLDEHRALIKVDDGAGLLAAAEDAIRTNNQGQATAAIQIYGDRGYPVDPVFDLMIKYAISEDGRLHGEKFYHTVREEYRTTRQAFRWRQIVALARVTTSAFGYNREDQHGFRAAGYDDACKLLGVEA